MTSTAGIPPLHSRCDEKAALTQIKNRYKRLRPLLEVQVKSLQESDEFRAWCQQHYGAGYKDWCLLTAIFNQMLAWRASELSIDIFSPAFRNPPREVMESLRATAYSTSRFLGTDDLEMQLEVFNINCLITYGFHLRRADYHPRVVLKFLRTRMRHFEFDLPHQPLFGTPVGTWPM